MSHTIHIEGSDEAVEAEAGDTILDACLLGGVEFAYSCQAGNCGTCRCELLSGDILELEYSEHALAEADRARGIVLACRTQVWSDVHIRRAEEDDLAIHPSRVLACRVAAIDSITHDIWRVRLDIVTGGPFSFSAGQYASIEFPFARGVSREYSMAGRPDQSGLEFHVREGSAGSVTAGLGQRLRVGDELRVAGPNGSAHLRAKHVGPIIAIAGGSGLAPIRSILSTLRNSGADNPLHVYFGARAARDVYAEEEMHSWVEGRAGSRAQVVLSEDDGSRADQPWRSGNVTDAVDADFASLDGFKAYVAGPPAMVEAATRLLLRKGVALRDIHADPTPAAAAAPASATVRAA